MAQERLESYPGKTEFSLEVGHPSERIIALSKNAIVMQSLSVAVACPVSQNSSLVV